MHHVLVAAAVLVLLATACGGDEKPDAGDTPSAGSSGPPVTLAGTVNDHGTADANATSGEVKVALDDFFFAPTFVRATPGATVTLRLENAGEVPHTFTVDGGGADVTVAPGTTGDASVTLPRSGAVRFYCRFHQAQGMQGAFYFTPGDTVAPGGAGGSAPADGDGAYGS